MAHAGQSVNLAWDASPTPSVAGYTVYYGPAPGNYTNQLSAGSALTLKTPTLPDGLYYFTVTAHDTNGVESDYSNVISTNIATATAIAPSITSQPASMTATAGSSATFSVAASGTAPMNYQWRFNGASISGATASAFTIASVQSSDAGTYSCVVANSAGSATSAGATLTVNVPATPPSITSNPISKTVTVGSSASFSIGASGTGPLSYQWQFNGNALAGATGSICTIANAQANNAGNYVCIVANSAGSATSAAATLTLDGPPAITSQPSSVTVDPGAAATFVVGCTGASLSYQWRFNGNSISGATGSSFTVASPQSSDAGTYTCFISNPSGSATTVGATLTIGTYISSSPASQTVTATSPVSLTVTVTGTTNNTFQWLRNGSPIIGATNATYSIASALRADAGTYTVSVTGNRTVTSSPAVLSVIDPVFYQQPASTNIVVGQAATFRAAAIGTAPIRYQWWVIKTGSAAVAITGATNTSFTLSSTKKNDAGTYYCVASNGASSQSANAVLGIYAKQSQIPASAAMVGSIMPAVNISVSADGSLIVTWDDASFSLQSSDQIAGPWTTLAGATSPYTNSVATPMQFFRLIQ